MEDKGEKKRVAPNRFSTFSGVFVPSTLAILGAVMYYIAPKITGGVGLGFMLVIILIAHSITLTTAFSISSVATNTRVKGGGLYYLISRSLGREFGGSMGIQLFLAQTVAVSFYIIAFSKAVFILLSSFGIFFSEVNIALVSCLVFGVFVFKGARFVIRLQHFIFAAIILSLFSIFLGPNTFVSAPSSVGFSIPFWVAFAMFFPAVTGIDAGVGMSGELKDPKKSLVRGTFFAIIFTMVVYIALSVKLSLSASPGELVNNPFIIHEIALWPQLVILGILLATSSSALSCLMTAPRSLRAMAKDRMFSEKFVFLGNSIGKSNEPRVALLVSLVIAAGVILIGGLDFVAQIVTIFFLNVYGWINGAAFLEKLSGNPSFRPSFNTPWPIALYGMVVCYVVMFLFNPTIMFFSILFQLFLFFLFYKTKRSAKIEGVWEGILFQFLRKVLGKIVESEKSRKNWRPTIVAFCAKKREETIVPKVLDWINSHRSVTKIYFLVPGKLKDKKQEREVLEQKIEDYVKSKHIELFERVVVSDDFRTSIKTALQGETLGNLPLNTVFLDFDERFKLSRIINDTVAMKKNMILLRNNSGFKEYNTLDVWWNTPQNGNFMLLLAYLITHSTEWREPYAIVRLFRIVDSEKGLKDEEARIEALVKQSRMENVQIHMVVKNNRDVKKIIDENSKDSDLVIIGLPHTGRKIGPKITNVIKRHTENLKVSLVVLAGDKIDFKVN
ncbi:MAG: hypothetical protein U9O94_04145 [Nanoarchaeota archaeon]|nr:hypothetical protein [Nanoarchaeota archaeon]